MKNLSPLASTPPQMPLANPYRNFMRERDPLSIPSSRSLFGVLIKLLVSSFAVITLLNDIYEGDCFPGLTKYRSASNNPPPYNSSPPPPYFSPLEVELTWIFSFYWYWYQQGHRPVCWFRIYSPPNIVPELCSCWSNVYNYENGRRSADVS